MVEYGLNPKQELQDIPVKENTLPTIINIMLRRFPVLFCLFARGHLQVIVAKHQAASLESQDLFLVYHHLLKSWVEKRSGYLFFIFFE